MENFTPVSAFIGGIFIGIAATILLLFNGRILGVSGIVAQTISKPISQMAWCVVFLCGLIVGAGLFRVFSGDQFRVVIDASNPLLILAGLCVGIGSNMGSGCTSGHGICGIARFSKRSIVATITFMLAGIVTVYLVRHVWGGVL